TTLGTIGNAAKPAAAPLTNLAKDDDETVRRQAIKALTAIRPGPQVMVPLVTRLIEDSDPAVKVRIMHAVSEAGPAAVPGLIEGLSNERAAYWACLILREMGPEAKDAVPALTALERWLRCSLVPKRCCRSWKNRLPTPTRRRRTTRSMRSQR